MAEIFGWEIKKRKDKVPVSPIPKEDTDGAVVVNAGGYVNSYTDSAGTSGDEAFLVQKYRNAAMGAELDSAIDEIVNEFVDIEEDEMVSIDFIKNKIDEKTKTLLIDEFNEVLRLLDFRLSCYNIIRRWYIDGRLRFHILIDKSAPGNGIQELRYIDPRKIRKIKEITKEPVTSNSGMNEMFKKVVKEYWIYNEKGFSKTQNSMNSTTSATVGIRISNDSVIDVPSGLMDPNNTMVLSYIDKAIKPLNQLKTLEDASVIYTLARSPERRIWYIDVAGLPTAKAEQHIKNQMALHKNKLSYDPATGQLIDQRKFITMLEDYWLPRRGEQGKGTEVTTLPAGQNFDKTQQLEYFQKNLYKSLNIPANRLADNDMYTLGRATQITRDEVKFTKFIARLRNQFSILFYESIKRNMILKNIITEEQWDLVKPYIAFVWESASYFEELKEGEILNDRLNSLNNISNYIGTFFSKEYVMKNVLRLSDEQIDEMKLQMEQEAAMESYDAPQGDSQDGSGSAGQEDSQDGSQDSGSPEDDKKQKILNARTVYDKLKDKENRTPREDNIFRSAAQILGKNKSSDKKTRKL